MRRSAPWASFGQAVSVCFSVVFSNQTRELSESQVSIKDFFPSPGCEGLFSRKMPRVVEVREMADCCAANHFAFQPLGPPHFCEDAADPWLATL